MNWHSSTALDKATSEEIEAVEFSSDGAYLASVARDGDGGVNIWFATSQPSPPPAFYILQSRRNMTQVTVWKASDLSVQWATQLDVIEDSLPDIRFSSNSARVCVFDVGYYTGTTGSTTLLNLSHFVRLIPRGDSSSGSTYEVVLWKAGVVHDIKTSGIQWLNHAFGYAIPHGRAGATVFLNAKTATSRPASILRRLMTAGSHYHDVQFGMKARIACYLSVWCWSFSPESEGCILRVGFILRRYISHAPSERNRLSRLLLLFYPTMHASFSVRPHSLTPQAQNCPTFRPPPLDGTYTVPELFEYNAEHNPHHPLFVYSDGKDGRVFLSYLDTWHTIKKMARFVSTQYGRIADSHEAQVINRPINQGPTIAILACADTISYVSLMAGMMRMGFVPFPLSIRNTAAIIAHLIRTNYVSQLYISDDAATKRLCRQAVELLEQDGWHIDVVTILQFDKLSNDAGTQPSAEHDIEFGKLDLDRVVIICHSSGSTSMPKSIFIHNRTFLQSAKAPWFGEVDLCNVVVSMHTCPLFHVMGLAGIIWPVTSGMIIGVFKPSFPPVIPTPGNYIEDILATNSEVVFCVPSFIEAWFRDPKLIPALKSFRAIIYAGAPLNKAVGDELATMGVKIFPLYGMTEIGPSIRFFLPKSRALINGNGYDDLYEATVIHDCFFKPNVINSETKDGRSAFRTGDLLQRHPISTSRWKVFGRVDDQITLSTGEKTNPVPLEAILSTDPHIAGAVIFGKGKFQNGVLIEPKEDFGFDPEEQSKLAEFRMKIWPSVERMNECAPGHSRLLKEMILVASPSKPFSYTAKGTPRRGMIVGAYKEEIEALYDSMDLSSQSDIPIPSSWIGDEPLKFVRSVIERAMRADLQDDQDIFQHGCDSLQAAYIRNSIIRALRQSTKATLNNVPLSLVYTNLQQPHLGLGHDKYKELQRVVTNIIHNAWQVDFNLTLSSFEPLIAGVRNLVQFSLDSARSTPPSILFISSISVLQNQPSSPSSEDPVHNAIHAIGTGYGESKWVAESILLRAMHDTGIHVNIVRVGQLCGDTTHGGWGEKEWVPSMLRSSQALKAIPVRDEMISWIPVDVAASALLEMAGSAEPVLHLVHPMPVPWTVFSDAASDLLDLPAIPWVEWVAKLQAMHADSGLDQAALGDNPAVTLLDFFSKYRMIVPSTERAVGVSGSLKEAAFLEEKTWRSGLHIGRCAHS
ncbi:Polyketide synthase HetM [Grifola frondosa]|uniref:Polyketide synthase HetM n=1 Tax=Grifola frondosa TaxID=5627 RepID=A0A1C7LLE8_GRIFR|nr:Polyketide synthase HetM [Grifola frondosa]